MAKIAVEQSPEPRNMREIAWLAVAPAEPREDGDYLAMPLRAHHHERGIESGAVERREGGTIARIHRFDEMGVDIAPRFLEQRDEIVSHRPQHRVLKIQQPARRESVAAMQA